MAKKNGGNDAAEKLVKTATFSKLVSKGKTIMTAETNTAVAEQPETAKAEPRMRVGAMQAYGLTAERIAELVEAGDVANIGATELTISAKVTKAKDEVLVYEKLIALTFAGALALSGGKEEPATVATEGAELTDEQKAKGACDHFNYGFDLEIKRILRGKLAELIEGPAKVIAKAAQNLLDNGGADDLESAVAMVKAWRVKKGLPV
jgi:hypothetical protein